MYLNNLFFFLLSEKSMLCDLDPIFPSSEIMSDASCNNMILTGSITLDRRYRLIKNKMRLPVA